MKSYVGVDLGGTRTKLALANADGEVQRKATIATQAEEGPSVVLQRIGDAIHDLACHTTDVVHGIGVGVPGLVDLETGSTKFLPNLSTHWRDVPVAETLRARFDCDIRLLNDVRTATNGELHYGHGRDRDRVTMAFLSIGTGIGGGLVIDGKLRLGPLGAAGEMGHQTLVPDGPRCGCGNHGCLEALASGPALAAEGARLMRIGLAPSLHQLVNGSAENVTPEKMSLAAPHDAPIADAITKAGDYLGIAMANVVSTLHPDLIVIGGGVAQMGDRLLKPIRHAIQNRVRMFPTDSIQVLPSKLGDAAGVLGAVALAMHGDATPNVGSKF
ncbi:MAG: ROK family protein [Planctomycetota bacterium]